MATTMRTGDAVSWIPMAALAVITLWSIFVNDLRIDLPPRAAKRARVNQCDHCRERDAFFWCETCGFSACSECSPKHMPHLGDTV